MVSYLVVFLLGVLTTVLILSFKKKSPDGTLRINTYDPDKDVYLLELDTPLNEVATKSTIMFKVVIDSKP